MKISDEQLMMLEKAYAHLAQLVITGPQNINNAANGYGILESIILELRKQRDEEKEEEKNAK